MDNILKFFNTNSDGIQAVSAILMFVATLSYVIINSLMHREIVKERERYENPDINLRFKPITPGAYYNLVIENISQVSAKDIEFVDFPSIKLLKDVKTDSIGFIKNGISFMGPKQMHESLFLDVANNDPDKLDISFKIKYKNKYNEVFTKNIDFNSQSFKHIYSLGKPFKKQIINELNGIKNSLDQ